MPQLSSCYSKIHPFGPSPPLTRLLWPRLTSHSSLLLRCHKRYCSLGACETSPVKNINLPRMQPPHLLPALSSGFRLILQTHPRRQPHMRFLSVGSRFCLQLPSDPASRQRPCSWLTIQTFLVRAVLVVDFHHQIDAHAGQTKKTHLRWNPGGSWLMKSISLCMP